MKKTLVVLLAVASMAVTAISSAQTAGPQGGAPAVGQGQQAGRHGAGAKKLQEALSKLNITDAQKSQIKDIMSKMQAERKDLMGQVKAGKLTKDQARAQMMEKGKASREAIMKILTPEQKKELAATLKADRKGNKGGKAGKGNKAGSPPPSN